MRVRCDTIYNSPSTAPSIKLVLKKCSFPSFPACLYAHTQGHICSSVLTSAAFSLSLSLFLRAFLSTEAMASIHTSLFPAHSLLLFFVVEFCLEKPLPGSSNASSLLRLLLPLPSCPTGVDTPDHGDRLLRLLKSSALTLPNLEGQDFLGCGRV